MSDAARLKATVYVGGLDFAVDARMLTDAFLPFGEIVEVSLPKPEAPSAAAAGEPHRGFGYVEFEVPGDAREAIDNMDQSELCGRVLKVAAAKPQKNSATEGLGSKTAVWEQEGWLAKNAVSEEDKAATTGKPQERMDENEKDPMQTLDQLGYAGPSMDG